MRYSDFVIVLMALCAVMLAVAVQADELTLSVQQQLHAQGVYSGPLDGKSSEELTKALKDFQQRHHLPASGVLDRATAKALDDESGLALPEVPSQIPTPAPSSAADDFENPREQIRGYGATPTPMPTESPAPLSSPSPSPSLAPSESPTIPATTPLPIPNESPSPTEQQPSPVASPSPPEEAPPQFTIERVTEFLRNFVEAGEGKYVTPQLRFYSFPVNYFARGKVSAASVRSEILRNMRRWPRRSYRLVEPVMFGTVNDETATVDFTLSYTVQKGKQKTSGKRKTRVTLRDVKGELKIVAIKSQR
jgi:hypothetical protein